MKRLGGILIAAGLVAVGAHGVFAADLKPVLKAPPVVAPLAYDWTGFYVGGHLGAKRGKADFDDSARDVLFPGFITNDGFAPGIPGLVLVPSRFGTIPAASGTNTGFVAGGQLGYNWQMSNYVFGFEADANWNSVRPSVTTVPIDPFLTQTLSGTATAQIDWTASLRARGGVTFDRLLVYATGGLAIAGGKVNSSFTLTNPITGIFFPVPFAGTTTASERFTKIGWTIGGGLEYAIDRRWSIAGEYRYTDYGRKGVTLANTDPAAAVDGLGIVAQNVGMRLRTDEATVRLNYRWDPSPIVARY